MLTRAVALAQGLEQSDSDYLPRHELREAAQLLRDYAALQASLYQLSLKLSNPALEFTDRTIEAALVDFAVERIAELQAELLKKDEEIASWRRVLETMTHERDQLKSCQVSMQKVLTEAQVFGGRWIDHSTNCELGLGDRNVCTCGLENWLKQRDAALAQCSPATTIPDEREDPCHRDYVGELELPLPTSGEQS